MSTRKLVTVAGARPQFIKVAALSRALRAHPEIEDRLIHTGQHYDDDMSTVFFDELEIPAPAHHLGITGRSHGEQTGRMLEAIERVLLAERPHGVLVYGDTNSTLAGALAAAKLDIPVFHVEAGLRSFNRKMPEETNRVLTDHVSAALFCPTRLAVANLEREGLRQNVHMVGDVMYDVALRAAEKAESRSRFRDAGLPERGYVLATVHRAENTDDTTRLRAILDALGSVAERRRVLFPMHPRTKDRAQRAGIEVPSRIEVTSPLGFLDMAYLEHHAQAIVTDSGGVQKEAYFHGTPCVTVRTESEWVETIDAGWNRLAAPDDSAAIVAAVESAIAGASPRRTIEDYGTGQAGERIAAILQAMLA